MWTLNEQVKKRDNNNMTIMKKATSLGLLVTSRT